MRPGTKLAIMLASGALVWGIIAMAVCWREKPQKRAVRVAQTALHASVDNPESVKVIAVSDPDSVFRTLLHRRRGKDGDSRVYDEGKREGDVADRQPRQHGL